MKDTKHYTEANRKAWNTAMPFHRNAMDEKWDKAFADKSFVIQKEPELSALEELGIKDKDIVQLCCNNGLELLSLKRMGANRCLGIDIADEAISDAKSRASRFGIDAEFLRSSVYEIPEAFDNSFDLVYITIGALTWLPDLKAFFRATWRLLRPNGRLYIYEQHPFMQVLPWDVSASCDKASIENNYFSEGFQLFNDSLDYYGNQEYDAPDTYEFMHTLSDIFTAIIDAPLCIKGFKEYEHDISCGYGWVQKLGLRLPLCFMLWASK